jgi:hypothetical protein
MVNYEKYASIKAQIKALQTQADIISGEILKDMREKGEKKVELPIGSFTITTRKSWTYPESVNKINEEYKAAKATAESTGTATYTEDESLRFVEIKL